MNFTVDQFLPKTRQNDLDEQKKTLPAGETEEDEDRKREMFEPFSFETASLLLDSRVAFTSVLCII